MFLIEEELKKLPGKPGVYIMHGEKDEINEEISKMAEMYKMEADKVRELLGEQGLGQMKEDLAVQKAVTMLADAAKEA